MTDVSRRELLKLTGTAAGGGAITYAATNGRARFDREEEDETTTPRGGARSLPSDSALARENTYFVPPADGIGGIQAVIDDHAPDVTVVLGSGTYVGSELTVRHDVRLIGAGVNATTLKLADGANTDLVVTPNPDRRASLRVRMEHLTCDGNKAHNSTGDIVYGVFWNGRFVDCEFVDAPTNGFWLAGSPNASTDNNVFRNCLFARSKGNGLRLGGSRTTGAAVGVARIDTCWFGRNGGDAMQIRGNGNFVTSGKFYENAGTDVYIDRGHRNLVLDSDLSKPIPTAPCISVRSAKGVDSSGNRIAGNVIYGSFPDAVFCRADGNDVRSLQIQNNMIDGSGEGTRTGIRAVGGEYIGCVAQGNAVVGSFSEAAIQLPSSWTTTGNSA
ncbi:right-handed parallel beta-helix repeat-containing protein [Halogeometricum luteum]|uniref:Right-handed parallel beta-helix repeat-containing protein n=1 Tax=Halogeometricum luteum TaxID=2950537 RepID=A0ABU2G3D4_9EURY|nr:right-handed parallel beta-helix repeat-containing protein [Halogeometricum sp. S3BR5-2]MDS0295300.1 right-handed parallel beta-helix repeat-containing protein [Halogeometricum sp. S3BR5-2]